MVLITVFAIVTANPCALVTKVDAAALLGAEVAHQMPEGPVSDEDSGARKSTCIFLSGNGALAVILLEFSSPAEAKTRLTEDFLRSTMDEDDIQVGVEPGLGDHAYWVHAQQRGEWVVLKGRFVLGLAFGVEGRTPASYKAELRRLTTAALPKL